MQTTLLGLAIAFILALIAALVGPHFVDWNRFRPQFEAEASRVVGAPVHVGGKLDVLLLPTPTLQLSDLAVGADGDPAKVRADKLDVEFNLGSLMRGEWRASELSLSGLDLDIGLDERGRFEWPSAVSHLDVGSVAIDRLNLAGRLRLHDQASGMALQLDGLRFGGDVRPLAGAVRGDGSFTLLGARTPFRISSGQTADGKGTRLHLAIDAGERPLSADLDGTVTFEGSVPKFEGGVTLARPADAKASPAGRPWRIASKLKAAPSAATFEQIEVAYGPDDSALRLTGTGEARFGTSPLLRVTLAARQLDVDRLFGGGGPDADPIRLIPSLRALVAALPLPPLPVQLEANADQIALGGRPVQNVAAELRSDGSAWTVGKLEMRAPGATRMFASGTIAEPGPSARFTGPISIESGDPGAFTGWLQGRNDIAYRNQKPLRLRGEVTIAADRLGVEGLNADINGTAMQGRLALSTADGKSRFDAALKAANFDLTALSSLLSMLTGPQTGLPDEAQVSLEADRAMFAGQEVRPAAAKFSYGPKAISLDDLRIGDAASGVGINGTGSFDRIGGNGKLTLAASAPSLAEVGTFVAPFAPLVAERLNAVPKMPGTAHLQLTADAGKSPNHADQMNARAVLDIDTPQVKGSVTVAGAPPLVVDLAALKNAAFNLETELTSDQTSILLALLGLDRVIGAKDGAAQFDSTVSGAWGSPMQVKATLTGAGVDGDIRGTGDLSNGQPAAALDLAVRQADLAPLFALKPGSAPLLEGALSSRVGVSGNAFTFDNLDSTIGGARMRGHVTLTRGEDVGVDGTIGFDTLDLPGAAALAFGAAGHPASEPLGPGWLRGWRGQLVFQALSGVVPGGGELRPFSGTLKGDGQSLVIENAKGGIGGGEATVNLDARQTAQGLSFNARLQIADADGPALRYRSLALPEGKASLQMTVTGQARSASGIGGALSGGGTLILKDMRVAGLDPRAFDAALRAGDSGQASDDLKLKAIVEPVLAANSLVVPSAQIPFTIRDGRLRVETALLQSERARVTLAGGYDLLADQADIRAIMSPVTDKPLNGRPEIRIDLNGSPDGLARTTDVAALSSWLSMRAVDRETRRLDQLERGVTEPQPETESLWEAPQPQVAPLPPSEVRMPSSDPRRKAPAAAKPAPARIPPQASNPSPPVREAPAGSAAAPPLPPPLDIRPAPGTLRVPRQRPAAAPPGGTF